MVLSSVARQKAFGAQATPLPCVAPGSGLVVHPPRSAGFELEVSRLPLASSATQTVVEAQATLSTLFS